MMETGKQYPGEWLGERLGIRFMPIENQSRQGSEPFCVTAEMPCDSRTAQPFGYLCGGASLALAEILAGYGSMALVEEGQAAVGGSVSASHVSAMPLGGRVRAQAVLLHKGRLTHLWNVDITDAQTGRLVSTARVTNHIISTAARKA